MSSARRQGGKDGQGRESQATADQTPGEEPVWRLKNTFDCWVNAHSDLVILEGELLELAIKAGEGRCAISDLDALTSEVQVRREMCQKMLSDALGARSSPRERA